MVRYLGGSGQTFVTPCVYSGLRVTQHIAAAPNGFDIALSTGGRRKFLAQFANKHVDDLQLGFIHAALEMVQEHLLGQGRPLPETQKFQHLVLFASQMYRCIVHINGLCVKIYRDRAGLDDRL